jgi:protein-S-isoprenylcysteine O-methyltransferase Ste14
MDAGTRNSRKVTGFQLRLPQLCMRLKERGGMDFITALRYLLGYAVGFSIFIVAIPCAIYYVSGVFSEPAILNNHMVLVIAVLLGSIGIFFVLWSNAVLFLKGKGGPTDGFNVAISPRTRHLVVTGPYRYSRNPMVFGAFCCYFALAFLWNSAPALLFLAVFYIFAVNYLKATEEKRLLRDFGPEYAEYQKSVNMILPRVGRKAR